MPSLARNLTIGVVVSVLILGALAATVLLRERDDSLASRLPSERVLFYMEGENLAALFERIKPVAPFLPEPPSFDGIVAAAAVRLSDGKEGWIMARRSDTGKLELGGSDPTLETVLTEDLPRLAGHAPFQNLRFDDASWAYLGSPIEADGSSLAKIFSSGPIALRFVDESVHVRIATLGAMRAPMRSPLLVTLKDPVLFLHIPPARTLERLEPAIDQEARTIIEAIAGGFLSTFSPNMSLRYDLPALFTDGAVFQKSMHGTYALEGEGRSASDVSRMLERLHSSFASLHGGSSVKTIVSESFSMRTLTQSDIEPTQRIQDGTWTVRKTVAGDRVLISAEDLSRYVITTDEEAFATHAEQEGMHHSFAAWSEVGDILSPLWPGLKIQGDSLRWTIEGGQGFIEILLLGVESI